VRDLGFELVVGGVLGRVSGTVDVVGEGRGGRYVRCCFKSLLFASYSFSFFSSSCFVAIDYMYPYFMSTTL
jgi:hypothetical protein